MKVNTINALLLVGLLSSCNLSHVLKFEHEIESITKAAQAGEENDTPKVAAPALPKSP